jgi:hypothetical protein
MESYVRALRLAMMGTKSRPMPVSMIARWRVAAMDIVISVEKPVTMEMILKMMAVEQGVFERDAAMVLRVKT